MDANGFNSMYVRINYMDKFEKDQFREEEKNLLASLLSLDRPRRQDMKRCLSIHVGSRWYRAPEISLLERQYDQASDLWSFGCTLYELIKYTIRNDKTEDR